MEYYKTKNEIITYLENGNNLERKKALESTVFLSKTEQKELNPKIFNIFISDENRVISMMAFRIFCRRNPKTIPDTIKYIEKQMEIIKESNFQGFIGNRKLYDNYSSESKYRFYEDCIKEIGSLIYSRIRDFKDKKKLKQILIELIRN